jgi:predicted enzyme related to lactoylglutathione lyase
VLVSGPGIELHLGVEEPFAPARKAHPALIVEDLDDLEGRLADSGHDTRPDAPIDVIRRFHASDPFGNRLEFMAPS